MTTKPKTKKNDVESSKDKVSVFSPSQVKKFCNEVKTEFSKIVWPDKKVTLSLTGIVIVLSLVVAAYLGSVDLLLGKLVSTILQ